MEEVCGVCVSNEQCSQGAGVWSMGDPESSCVRQTELSGDQGFLSDVRCRNHGDGGNETEAEACLIRAERTNRV